MGRRGRPKINSTGGVGAVAGIPPVTSTAADVVTFSIPDASWPDAVPHPNSDLVMTISCGNTHYYWAIHYGPQDDLNAHLYWRTCVLPMSEMTGDPCKVMSRYLPDSVQEMVYGAGTEKATQTRASSTKFFSQKRVPFFYVYIVSTNTQNEIGLSFLFRDLPCRLFHMTADHYYTEQEGAYPGFGVDRLASARGAVDGFGAPALVIDGGTAMTFTRVDADGLVAGGGICAGVDTEVEALKERTGALPEIDVRKEIDAIKESGTPLPLFCNNTTHAILGTVLRSKLKIAGEVIQAFGSEHESMKDLTVCLAGGYGKLLEELLSKDKNQKILKEHVSLPENINVVFHKYLIHAGTVRVLMSQYAKVQDQKDSLQVIRDELIGQRVARSFPNRPDIDGDTIYRGTVVAIDTNEEVKDATVNSIDSCLFFILFDDGDREDLSVGELYDALLLFASKGDKWQAVSAEAKDDYQKKQHDSSKCAKVLAEKSPQIQKKEERKRQDELEKMAKASALAAAAAVTAVTSATDTAVSKKRSIIATDAAKTSGADEAAGNSSDAEPLKKKANVEKTDTIEVTTVSTIVVADARAAPTTPAAVAAELAFATASEAMNEKPENAADNIPALLTQSQAEVPAVGVKVKGTPASKANSGKTPRSVKGKVKVSNQSDVNLEDPKSIINTRIAKYFDLDEGQVLYFGEVTDFYPAEAVAEQEELWHVVYDDGDEEDLDKAQITSCLELYQKKKKGDRTARKKA